MHEIFAASVLSEKLFPDLIHDQPKLTGSTYVLPHVALRDVPADLRSDD